MNLYIDYGGTNFRTQIDDNPITTTSSENIDLKEFLDQFLKENRNISFIGVSFAGTVCDGKILLSPNTKTENFDIKSYIEKTYHIPLSIDNDLNCAALAEQKVLEVNSLAVFYIGTGFGSAFIDGGKLVKGFSNKSGEIGHIPFNPSPFGGGCGRDDCIELYTSGSGIQKWCEFHNISKEFQRLDKLHINNTLASNTIVENFYAGLAHAFHTALNLFDFENLVLGGSVGNHQFIKEFLEKESLCSSFKRKKLNITLSTLKQGSLEGAKLLH